LVGVAFGPVFGFHLSEPVERHGPAFGPRAVTDGEGDVVEDGPVRQQQGILEDHAHSPLLGRNPDGVVGVDEDFGAKDDSAVVGAFDPGDHPQGEALAGTRGDRRAHRSPHRSTFGRRALNSPTW
jgi:hypothetical protein